jgi:hypothetical protein
MGHPPAAFTSDLQEDLLAVEKPNGNKTDGREENRKGKGGPTRIGDVRE